MTKISFSFKDIEQECDIELDCYRLQSRPLGLKIHVPEELYNRYPFNSSAYDFLQQLRPQIFEFGVLEFPNLPVNKLNHTLAQRSPMEHTYSSNTYMTDGCQQPHQDTPPYPTGFWLNKGRKYYATWVLSVAAVNDFFELLRSNPELDIDEVHRQLLPITLKKNTALLLNQKAGLLLIDNSDHHSLYHARTCNFDVVAKNPEYQVDSPMYTYSEIGLLKYIDTLDSRRGDQDRDIEEREAVKNFIDNEQMSM